MMKKIKMIEMMSLPRELIMECIARVPRCYYPTLSLVSKLFRSIVASPELYTSRSLLGCPECYIYVSMLMFPTKIRWYVLERKTPGRSTTKNCLVAVPKVPYMSLRSSLAVVGSTIFIMGGGGGYEQSVNLINCPSNKWRISGNMPRPMECAHADIVDGKIYVVAEGRILVYDTEKQTWEELETRPDMGKDCLCCVAMSGKIYIRTDKDSFVYEPKKGNWETDDILDSKPWKNACSIDDVLYYYDTSYNKLNAYETKEKSWKVVKGVEGLPKGYIWSWSCVTSHCGKLVLFLMRKPAHRNIKERKEFWGGEITLGKRQGEEIWGKFEWCNVVLNSTEDFLDRCLSVTV